jgi:CheY-like chemotaxis protein
MSSQGKVLVVDDNASLVKMIEGVLRRHDFDVTTAYDGIEALNKVQLDKPDLIVLDIIMPGMDGYEVCRRLHNQPATADIPVILLTVKGQVDDPDLDPATLDSRIAEQMAGYEVGAIEFLPKPVRAVDLLERIRSYILLDRAAAERSE